MAMTFFLLFHTFKSTLQMRKLRVRILSYLRGHATGQKWILRWDRGRFLN